ELLNGNVHTMKKDRPVWQQVPSPELRTAFETGMKKLGVKVDWSSRQTAWTQRVEYYLIHTPVKTTESDRLVLGQIKASAEERGVAKPQMITGEKLTKPMHTEAPRWGIESIATAKPKPGSPTEPPRIILAEEEYPRDNEGKLTRFFKDRPVLKRLGLIGINM